MSKMNEASQQKDAMDQMREFGIMECKLDIMKILLKQPTPEAQVAAIKDYLKGLDND